MSALGWVVVVCAILIVAVAAALFVTRGSPRAQLRRRFGPEYERMVQETGDRRLAEERLTELARRRDGLDVRPLGNDARRAYVARWETVQVRFVDDPAGATTQADNLVTEVMKARGYPVESFEEKAGLLATDHSRELAGYRAAHAARAEAAGSSNPDTERLRAAVVQYRILFLSLVGPLPEAPGTAASTRAVDTSRVEATPAASAPPRQRGR